MKGKKNKEATSENKELQKVYQELLGESENKEQTKRSLDRLVELSKIEATSNVEVFVPISSVSDTVDMGAYKLSRCSKGFLFTAKGGIQTLVSWGEKAICSMLETLMDIEKTKDKEEDKDAKQTKETFSTAVKYVFGLTPFVASMGIQELLAIATCVSQTLEKSANKLLEEAAVREESEQDVKDNIEYENQLKALKQLVDEFSNLPNVD
jgi:leucyl-tRNA synthetase